MKKRNKILNTISLLIFLSIFQNIFSQSNQTNTPSSLEIFNKCLSKYEVIINRLKKLEIKMQDIKFNIKLKLIFRNLKELNETMSKRITGLQNKFEDKKRNINKLNEEINILNTDMNFLERKTLKFIEKYNSYDKFKSDILNYIKIFFICFFSVVFIMLIILVIVGIRQYKKRKKYYRLHEEVSLNQDRKSFNKITDIPDKKMVRFEQDEKSSGRDIKIDMTPKSKEFV